MFNEIHQKGRFLKRLKDKEQGGFKRSPRKDLDIYSISPKGILKKEEDLARIWFCGVRLHFKKDLFLNHPNNLQSDQFLLCDVNFIPAVSATVLHFHHKLEMKAKY